MKRAKPLEESPEETPQEPESLESIIDSVTAAGSSPALRPASPKASRWRVVCPVGQKPAAMDRPATSRASPGPLRRFLVIGKVGSWWSG